MCESPTAKGRTGWRGWLDLPSTTAPHTDEKWVDLTHPFSTSVPRSAMFPPPRFSYFAQMPEKPLNVTHMETIVHMGTHVDAPRLRLRWLARFDEAGGTAHDHGRRIGQRPGGSTANGIGQTPANNVGK